MFDEFGVRLWQRVLNCTSLFLFLFYLFFILIILFLYKTLPSSPSSIFFFIVIFQISLSLSPPPMADRVHPADSPRPSTSDSNKPPSPPPGTYVIQLPKDQIYRVPPPKMLTASNSTLAASTAAPAAVPASFGYSVSSPSLSFF